MLIELIKKYVPTNYTFLVTSGSAILLGLLYAFGVISVEKFSTLLGMLGQGPVGEN